MPERILRDLTDSDRYNGVSPNARDLFIRLLNKADDFGLFFADARRLRPLLFPLLLNDVREADLQRWTAECGKAGLVRLYEVEGRHYLQVMKWRQRLRNKFSKYPAPPWGLGPPPDDGHLSDNRTADDSHPRTETNTDTEAQTKGGELAEGFKRFWEDYPATHRKADRMKCLSHWRTHGIEEGSADVLKSLAAWKKSRDWTKDDGQYIPAPLVWLRKSPWESAPPPPVNGTAVNKPLTGTKVYDQEADQ